MCVCGVIRVKGLPTKKKYRFRVLAENLAGPGKPSVETDPVLIKDPIGRSASIHCEKKLSLGALVLLIVLLSCIFTFFNLLLMSWCSSPDPPWAPGKPVIRDVGKTTALLAWTRPEHDGGAKIEGYIIEFQKTGSEDWIRLMDDVPQTEQHLQGLMEKQEYSFRVKAVNKAGESEASEPSDPVVCKERLCTYSSSIIL